MLSWSGEQETPLLGSRKCGCPRTSAQRCVAFLFFFTFLFFFLVVVGSLFGFTFFFFFFLGGAWGADLRGEMVPKRVAAACLSLTAAAGPGEAADDF